VPNWLIIALVVVMLLIVVGFFALMFAEMGNKRASGRFSASTPQPPKGGGARGPSKPKPRKRKSR
jgi:flagellar basal body-associated protein FliL